MVTHSVLTYHLADAIAIYLIATCTSGLIAPERWRRLPEELAGSFGLTFAMAGLAYLVGVVVLLIHWSFADPLAIVVTVFGLIWVGEGILLLIYPQLWIKLGRLMFGLGRLWAVVGLLAGLALLIVGLTITLVPISP